MVWRFCMTFADILGLWPFTLDEFVQALHDYDSRLLGEVHIALLRLIIRDIEDAARTPSGGPGTNHYTVANPEGGNPQIVEGFALSAGFGPQLKKHITKCTGLTENDEGKGCEEVITMLRNGSAAENAPSTYCVSAKEKIQIFTNGFLAGVNFEDVDKEEDYEEGAEGTTIDDFGASSTNKDNFFSEDVKTFIHKDVDADMKTDIKMLKRVRLQGLPYPTMGL